MADLIECHDACHDDQVGRMIGHTHTRYDDHEEWVW